ncbi:hypothetical protein RJ639_007627 [Escallonia herrerae]|uniref:Uncharacterized protein n=1 Tax=Escallonia herrerae TaxID=1293975 RepID=A0AA89AV25_9ASTE|nr:hypothetical protein RJ639_007627 [Escallonia herrerae]
MVNAKALCESLERKYKTEDADSKKFVVSKFLDFKMVDSKTVISQVQEFQLILHDIHAEGMVLGESFQVAALIEKLPPTWKDFKNYLKHKRKEMKLEDLIVRLRIEEDNRQFEKKAGNYHQEAKANVVEQVTAIFGTIIFTYQYLFAIIFLHKYTKLFIPTNSPCSASASPWKLALVKQPPLVLKYHNSQLLEGNITVSLTWYGKFSLTQRSIIVDFLQCLNSPTTLGRILVANHQQLQNRTIHPRRGQPSP